MGSWALVTGATAGIGESFTRLLAANNYNVVLVARDLPRLQERAKGLEEKYKVLTHCIQADPTISFSNYCITSIFWCNHCKL
jgi:short-subunit dehydrogenase